MLTDGLLRSAVLADAAVTAFVGARMHPIILPQHSLYPALSYSQVSGVRLYSLCGPDGHVQIRITINSWAETYTEVHGLADAVRGALTVPVDGATNIRLDNELDFFEPDASEKGVYRVAQDFLISFMED